MASLVVANATEYFIAPTGDDGNPGTAAAPLRTIQRGADLARPGDVITVRAGTYRERVDPPRGGLSAARRITYQAAAGEHVEIKGSEIINHWDHVRGDVWKATVPNSFFGKFNPFSDRLRGDWLYPRERKHHTGTVYLDGGWMIEAPKLDDVFTPARRQPLWFAEVDKDQTTIWAQFKGVDPNTRTVEVNARQTVFYPSRTGVDFLTIRGFAMRHAATPWAPPTAEQIGLLGTHWSKGWIIENNTISHSVCAGIALGKYGDEWDNKSEDSAEGYIKTIERALKNGWNKESIGHHLVRNNEISYCEQAGIVGSLGAAFSRIIGNDIHDIHVQRLYDGCEQAGIKFHGAIDVEISGNHLHRAYRGLWLDWMAQGTRVTGNLFHDNDKDDLFVEVNHGPFVVDNNIFLSPRALRSRSQGGAYAHNLFAGKITVVGYDDRVTPFLKAHSTVLAGEHDNPRGDDRYYNNIFAGPADLSPYDREGLPVWMGGNVFLAGAVPAKHEVNPSVHPNADPAIEMVMKGPEYHLKMTIDPGWFAGQPRKRVTTALLGKAAIPGLAFEQADGSPLSLDKDFSGKPRNPENPAPGPIELPGNGPFTLKVW